MKTLTVTHHQYQEVAKFGRPLKVEREPSRRTLEKRFTNNPNAKEKRPPIDQPMQVTDLTTGEIMEIRRVETGCGIQVNDLRDLKWWDEDAERARGGVVVICTEISKDAGGVYTVTFEQTTKSRAVPLGADTLLAPVTGYTGDPTSTIDDEASAMWSPEVAAAIADEEEGRKSRAKVKSARELHAMKERLDQLDIENRHKDRIKRDILGALRSLSGSERDVDAAA